MAETHPNFLHKIVTGDELWYYDYNHELVYEVSNG